MPRNLNYQKLSGQCYFFKTCKYWNNKQYKYNKQLYLKLYLGTSNLSMLKLNLSKTIM